MNDKIEQAPEPAFAVFLVTKDGHPIHRDTYSNYQDAAKHAQALDAILSKMAQREKDPEHKAMLEDIIVHVLATLLCTRVGSDTMHVSRYDSIVAGDDSSQATTTTNVEQSHGNN